MLNNIKHLVVNPTTRKVAGNATIGTGKVVGIAGEAVALTGFVAGIVTVTAGALIITAGGVVSLGAEHVKRALEEKGNDIKNGTTTAVSDGKVIKAHIIPATK